MGSLETYAMRMSGSMAAYYALDRVASADFADVQGGLDDE